MQGATNEGGMGMQAIHVNKDVHVLRHPKTCHQKCKRRTRSPSMRRATHFHTSTLSPAHTPYAFLQVSGRMMAGRPQGEAALQLHLFHTLRHNMQDATSVTSPSSSLQNTHSHALAIAP